MYSTYVNGNLRTKSKLYTNRVNVVGYFRNYSESSTNNTVEGRIFFFLLEDV